jgi:hypothetical protein
MKTALIVLISIVLLIPIIPIRNVTAGSNRSPLIMCKTQGLRPHLVIPTAYIGKIAFHYRFLFL